MSDPIASCWSKIAEWNPPKNTAFAWRTQDWAFRNIWNQSHLALLIE